MQAVSLGLSEVDVKYGDIAAALNINLRLNEGVTALVGPNGAGKSTLLRVLAGVHEPSSGKMEALGGNPYGSASERVRYLAQVGWMPQRTKAPATFTVARLLAHASWLKGVARRREAAAIEFALAATRTTHLAGRRLGEVSGGEYQRALLASCLVNDPKVLVLDEPTVGLDPGQRESFNAALGQVAETSCVILVTHILEDVYQAASRVIGMRDARIVIDTGATQDVQGVSREALMDLFRGQQ